MTSTRFNVGLSTDRVSSRVLQPPGGGHTDIFGGNPEPPRGRRLNPAAAAATSLGEYGKSNGVAQNGAAEPTAPAQTPEPPAEAPAQPTPAPEKPEPAKAAPEPPKRVRVPPGGFSSGLW